MIGLVLAAGQGTRMGGPKALLAWGGAPLALAHAEALVAAGARAVGVVVRPDVAEALEALPRPAAVVLVRSTEPEASGAAGSLRAGLAAVACDAGELVAITPTDALPVSAVVMAALVAAATASGAAKPVYAGAGGHPVVVRASWLGAYRDGAPTLRDVLRARGDAVARVAVDDPRVTADLDTPAELARWLATRKL
ncbi:MAG: NTP transferase domain-containing protein [Tetrasphaera sp.]